MKNEPLLFDGDFFFFFFAISLEQCQGRMCQAAVNSQQTPGLTHAGSTGIGS